VNTTEAPFAEIILPLAAHGTFTYRIPEQLIKAVRPGIRVVLPFGKRKLYTGLVWAVHHEEPKDYRVKELLELLDDEPILQAQHLQFWNWLAQYYLCSLGEVMQAALPAGLKLESQMRVLRHPSPDYNEDELSDEEFLIMEALDQQPSLSIAEISQITALVNPLRCVYNLLGRHCIQIEEKLVAGYRPSRKRYLQLGKRFTKAHIGEAFPLLERAPQQKNIILAYLDLARNRPRVLASRVLKKSGAAESSLKSLAKKEILQVYYADADPILKASSTAQVLPRLSEAQQTALDSVESGMAQNKPVLLHGITGSGKTELYIHLIQSVLLAQKQVLYLVPEIALTAQLISRLQGYFGESLLIYHSRYGQRQRTENWLKLSRSKEPVLIVGARSALLLPWQQPGLIVVDEEHEASYKQQAPAPRYQARDAALQLARQVDCPIILGSATPSYESYYHALGGKYHYVALKERFGKHALPPISTVDIKEAARRKIMHGHFSEPLVEAIKSCLSRQAQVILFQNRRGFSTLMQCGDCGEVVQCKNCDISLTYHKYQNDLRCHYCGYHRKVPPRCPTCRSYALRSLGFGTEKIEDDLQILFPEARIARMDLDTTRRKNAYGDIIRAFEEGETDILVGTQMVTKGLDFENVALVGVINADTLIHFPNFRSHERAFQLMTQVAGRAGRHGEQSQVLIQTSQPHHAVIQAVLAHQFEALYTEEIAERQDYRYPPAVRLIRITLRHKDQRNVEEKAFLLAQLLRPHFGERILGPEYPLVPRLKNRYFMEFMLKIERTISPSKVKKLLLDIQEQFEEKYPKQRVEIIYDVDP